MLLLDWLIANWRRLSRKYRTYIKIHCSRIRLVGVWSSRLSALFTRNSRKRSIMPPLVPWSRSFWRRIRTRSTSKRRARKGRGKEALQQEGKEGLAVIGLPIVLTPRKRGRLAMTSFTGSGRNWMLSGRHLTSR